MKANNDEQMKKHAVMGMAALLPGMVHMAELMQAEVDRMRARIAEAQGQEPKQSQAKTRKSGWSADPEERKVQQQIRRATMLANRKRATLREKRKEEWASMSVAKRKARLAKMMAGRKPVVKMEAVA